MAIEGTLITHNTRELCRIQDLLIDPPEGPYHWADGGETRLDNLVTLCRHHHRAVHEDGFGVRMNPNGRPEF